MITYRVVARKKPGTTDPEFVKYYASVNSPGKIDIEGLAKRISAMCTVTRADCLAVLAALQEQIVYSLQSGMRVHLGDVGCFRLSCQSEGAETADAFEVRNIKKLKVLYHPSTVLRQAVDLSNSEVSFYNLEKSTATEEEETEIV